jgi:hypothetical protein
LPLHLLLPLDLLSPLLALTIALLLRRSRPRHGSLPAPIRLFCRPFPSTLSVAPPPILIR